MGKDNKTRLVTGFLVALLVFVTLILGGPLFFLVIASFIVIGIKEYVKILNNKGFYPFLRLMWVVTLTLMLAQALGYSKYLSIIIIFGVIASFLAVLFKGRQPYIANVATTILGFLFAWLPSSIIFLRESGTTVSCFGFHYKTGLYYTLFVFFTLLLTDIAAYFFGTKLGKHKLAPVISPKKTVEGAIFGSIFGILTALLIGYLIKLPWYHSLILGCITTAFAQLGDLSESLIKRDAGVKDSGNVLPGHGGILDRADSYIFSAPMAYIYINFFVLSSPLIYLNNMWSKILHVIGF